MILFSHLTYKESNSCLVQKSTSCCPSWQSFSVQPLRLRLSHENADYQLKPHKNASLIQVSGGSCQIVEEQPDQAALPRRAAVRGAWGAGRGLHQHCRGAEGWLGSHPASPGPSACSAPVAQTRSFSSKQIIHWIKPREF